jgi:hypothetical protein
MALTLDAFLLFLRNIVSLFRKRWVQPSRVFWRIFAFLRLRLYSSDPKKAGQNRRNVGSRPAAPSLTTAVVCASQLPPALSLVTGGDTPAITSPTPMSTEVPQPTILKPDDTCYESCENNSGGCPDPRSSFRGGRNPISRSPVLTGHHDEHDSICPILPTHRGDFSSTPPISTSRPDSTTPSRDSHRPEPQYTGHHATHHPISQYSHPPSTHSFHPPQSGTEAVGGMFLSTSPRPSCRLTLSTKFDHPLPQVLPHLSCIAGLR